MCLFKWLNSSWSNLKKTVQYSSMVQLHDSAFTHKELALWVCCLCPRRTKDLKSSKLLAYAYNFLQHSSWFDNCKWRMEMRRSTASKQTFCQAGLYLHLGGWRRTCVLKSYCTQFQSRLERLVFSVAEFVGCKSFLDVKQGITLNIISVVLPFIYIQVF